MLKCIKIVTVVCIFVVTVVNGATREDVANFRKGGFIKPCKKSDMQCIQKTTQGFLEKTAKGISEHNIKPIDPLIVESLTYELGHNSGIEHHIKNLKVTGMKNIIIDDFIMDSNTVKFTMHMDLNLDGHLTIKFTNEKKEFSGPYTATAKVSATTYYPYTLKKGSDGADYYDVGDETYTYVVKEVPLVKPDPVLLKKLQNDIDIVKSRKIYLDNKEEILKQSAVKLLEVTVPSLIHNVKQAARMLPKETFFTD